jgi:hypothetical protein
MYPEFGGSRILRISSLRALVEAVGLVLLNCISEVAATPTVMRVVRVFSGRKDKYKFDVADETGRTRLFPSRYIHLIRRHCII